jgi:phosphopantothenoylcysteine decarboxylase|tara:strand:- start:7812 stop:8375 length:564 start_codon:yes stop_codon:yes gene_type:complete
MNSPSGNTTNRSIAICVTGGVSAYKMAGVVSALAQKGDQVTVILTPNAQRFVGEATFFALSGNPVITSVFDCETAPFGAHINVARTCRLLLVAPATANFIAKAANGISDCIASTTYLAFDGPIVVAPSMNDEMWNKAATQRNIKCLNDDGAVVIGPATGWLSCRSDGVGRLEKDDAIMAAIDLHYPN